MLIRHDSIAFLAAAQSNDKIIQESKSDKDNKQINNSKREWYVHINDNSFRNMMKPLHLFQLNLIFPTNQSSYSTVNSSKNHTTNTTQEDVGDLALLDSITINPILHNNRYRTSILQIKKKRNAKTEKDQWLKAIEEEYK